jgi:hypothetical protein
MSLGYLRLEKGALLKCPNPKCCDTIGRLAQDLRIGDKGVFLETNFGQGVRVDKQPRCKRCGFFWSVSEKDLMRVHTVAGWYPTETQLINAMNEG